MRPISILCGIVLLLSVISGVESVSAQSRKKIKVDSISFKGISAFSERTLSKVMITHKSRLLSSYRYNEDIFQGDLKALELFYHQNGYFDAVITDHHVRIDSTNARAYVDITISEGALTRIEGVSILGNAEFPDSLLLGRITVRSDEPFRQKKIDNSTVNLLTFYADNGYLDAEVKPDIRVNTETNRSLIDFYIKEKSQFTIGDMQVNGLEKTRKYVVMRELLFRTDEVVNYSQLLESQRKIYMTGLFQSVFIRPHVSSHEDSIKKDIRIEVKENMTGEFNMAFGYGSIDRLRGKMEVYNNNIRGKSHKLGIAGKVSYIERGIETSFTNPWTLGTPVRADVNLLLERKDEPGYVLDRIGGKVILGRQLRRNNITLTYRHERTTLRDIKADIVLDDLKSNTRSLKLSFIRDTRDNLFNSTKGLFFEASGEFGGFYTIRTINFYRCIGLFRYFYQLNTLTVAAMSFELGYIDAEDGFGSIPLHERFYTGGPNSVRGFEYEKVGPLDSKRVPTGGRLKIVWNPLEIRRTLYKMIGGVVFCDIGNVWSKPDVMSLRDLRFGAGAGLRVNTPIGLGRVDYGFNIDKERDEPKGQFYFSMGQAF